MPNEAGEILFPIRLSIKANNLVRKHFKVKGDLARLIVTAIKGTDWGSVEVKSRNLGRSKVKPEYKTTSIVMPAVLHEELTEYAEERDHSVSALIDAIVLDYYSPARTAERKATERMARQSK